MARRLKLPIDSSTTLELPLEGGDTVTFKSVPITMQVEDDLADIAKEISRIELDDDTGPLDEITATVEQLDVLLKRDAAANPDKPETPSEVLIGYYEANDPRFTGPVIRKLVQDVIRASRPT
jgi:hypothetical protein